MVELLKCSSTQNLSNFVQPACLSADKAGKPGSNFGNTPMMFQSPIVKVCNAVLKFQSPIVKICNYTNTNKSGHHQDLIGLHFSLIRTLLLMIGPIL